MYGSIAIQSNRNCRKTVRRQSRKSLLIAVLLVLSIVTIVVFSMNKTAQAEETSGLHKYYKTIVIQPDDTLWNLAETYTVKSEQSVLSYVSEVKEINHLGTDTIRTGMSIIVPYYAG